MRNTSLIRILKTWFNVGNERLNKIGSSTMSIYESVCSLLVYLHLSDEIPFKAHFSITHLSPKRPNLRRQSAKLVTRLAHFKGSLICSL